MREDDRSGGVAALLTYMFIVVVLLITLVPLYWMVVAASLPQESFFRLPPRILPGLAFAENFADLQNRFDFVRSIWNSVFVAGVYTLLSLVLCSMAGFAFAKYEFRFKEPLFYFILATVVLPIQILIIPLFLLMSKIGWTNTFQALILPWAANPVGIFLMRQNMRSIPDALLDSARIDGASEFQLYYRIALPMMKSSLVALSIILFITQWNAFLYPLVVLESPNMYTIPLALNELVGFQRVYFDQVMLAALLTVIPIFLLFLWLQRYFVRGIISGAVKQ